jgi:hypothetical protein
MTQTPLAQQAGSNYKNIATATSTLVKSGAGLITSVMVGTAQAGATMTVYDGLDNTGTVMGKVELDIMGAWTPPRPIAFTKGLFVVTTSLTTGSVTFLYN